VSELLKDLSLNTKGKNPLMMEFPVNPETSPYLVTAAGKSRLIWIPASNGKIKAGVRYMGDRGAINLAIVREIALVGLKNDWGNVHPFSLAGLSKAVEHLSYYGFTEVDILCGSDTLPFSTKHSVIKCDWLNEGCAILLPKDRAFVGVISSIGKGYAALVHNPSRGVAILGAV
tara:strand:- start:530 stop:1048 length:519 start_codon:yes stop_codon:yes gene_type:complete